MIRDEIGEASVHDFSAGNTVVFDELSSDDIYLYEAGDGEVVIVESLVFDLESTGDNDTLSISGYASTDVTVSAVRFDEDDVVLDFGGGDTIVLRDFLFGLQADAFASVETITFADGVSWNAVDLYRALLDDQISDGDDIVFLAEVDPLVADDPDLFVINAGLGDDAVIGTFADETLVFEAGGGHDVYNGVGGSDTVIIEGYSLDDMSFDDLRGNEVFVTFGNRTDSLYLDDIEFIVIDGVTYDLSVLAGELELVDTGGLV